MKKKRPSRVLVVDDSAFIRQYLKDIINQTEDLEVVATAADPLKAIQILKKRKWMLLRSMWRCPTWTDWIFSAI